MTKPPAKRSQETVSVQDGLYTVAQVAAMTRFTEKAIRSRIQDGSLLVHQSRPGARILISRNDLQTAGMLEIPATLEERAIRKMLVFLIHHAGEVFTTDRLRSEAARASRFADDGAEDPNTGELLEPRIGRPGYRRLERQKAETALATLRALGWVEKTTIPSASGSGRPHTGWRWIGPVDAPGLKSAVKPK
jgi:hypothetical protein